jgi:hypothetical protein
MIAAWAKPDPENTFQKALPISPGSRDASMIVPSDFLPTLLSVTGTPLPKDSPIDGHDFSPALRGSSDKPAKGFLVHFPHGKHNNELFSTWTEGSRKLIYQYETREWSLLDTRADIGEKNDLLKSEPKSAMELAKHMLAHMDAIGAQFPIDKSSGAPVKPDLKPLEALLGNH